jgi:hypothetical protein
LSGSAADPGLSQRVVLLHPKTGWHETTLAEAVRSIVLIADPLDRLAAAIFPDDAPAMTFPDIEAIYSRPEFPLQGTAVTARQPYSPAGCTSARFQR